MGQFIFNSVGSKHRIENSESIADLNRSTRTLRARATKIIPPHEIEFSEGVSIFIRERKIKIIMAHIIKDGQTCFKL